MNCQEANAGTCLPAAGGVGNLPQRHLNPQFPWRPNLWYRLRAFLLSRVFQAATQLAFGEYQLASERPAVMQDEGAPVERQQGGLEVLSRPEFH